MDKPSGKMEILEMIEQLRLAASCGIFTERQHKAYVDAASFIEEVTHILWQEESGAAEQIAELKDVYARHQFG